MFYELWRRNWRAITWTANSEGASGFAGDLATSPRQRRLSVIVATRMSRDVASAPNIVRARMPSFTRRHFMLSRLSINKNSRPTTWPITKTATMFP